MKHPLPLILILLAAATRQGLAQDTAGAKPLNVRLFSPQGHITTGYLYDITDTSLLLSTEKRPPRWYDTTTHGAIQTFGYHQMEHISFYRKGRVGRSTLIGLAIGAGTGLLLGFASGDDNPNQWFAFTAAQKAEGLSLFCGAIGTLTGLVVGLAKNKGFYIRGKKERYDRMRTKMAARLGLN